MQLHVCADPSEAGTAINWLSRCLAVIKSWMFPNFLTLRAEIAPLTAKPKRSISVPNVEHAVRDYMGRFQFSLEICIILLRITVTHCLNLYSKFIFNKFNNLPIIISYGVRTCSSSYRCPDPRVLRSLAKVRRNRLPRDLRSFLVSSCLDYIVTVS